MWHNPATGKAHKGKRIRHRGVTYRISHGVCYREDNCKIIGHVWGREASLRTQIDRHLAPRDPRPTRERKRRRFGKITPGGAVSQKEVW